MQQLFGEILMCFMGQIQSVFNAAYASSAGSCVLFF